MQSVAKGLAGCNTCRADAGPKVKRHSSRDMKSSELETATNVESMLLSYAVD